MRIAVVCRPPSRGKRSLTTQVAGLLEEWGAEVDLIHPQPGTAEVRLEHDLYVLRTVNDATLAYAAALDGLGATIVNPYPVARLCRDSVRVAKLLRRAGVPTAPFRSGGCRDRKLYCIGGQLFGVQREWPARTEEQKHGEPFTVTPELREIALTVGRVVGADLYGIDVGTSDGSPCVLEVNPFPGFKGVPQAALRVADYLYAAAVAVGESSLEVVR
ncbi:MAG: ATP-grasp domain-containing protein [Sporichthyaceae bacterium]